MPIKGEARGLSLLTAFAVDRTLTNDHAPKCTVACIYTYVTKLVTELYGSSITISFLDVQLFVMDAGQAIERGGIYYHGACQIANSFR